MVSLRRNLKDSFLYLERWVARGIIRVPLISKLIPSGLAEYRSSRCVGRIAAFDWRKYVES
jgi:hypothetical protein